MITSCEQKFDVPHPAPPAFCPPTTRGVHTAAVARNFLPRQKWLCRAGGGCASLAPKSLSEVVLGGVVQAGLDLGLQLRGGLLEPLLLVVVQLAHPEHLGHAALAEDHLR